LAVFVVLACSDRTADVSKPDGGRTPPGDAVSCVQSISPTSGTIGTTVTLTGTFGNTPQNVTFWDVFNNHAQADVQSWSPSQVVVSVPRLELGSWRVSPPGDCTLASFDVTVPSRVYIDNNVNGADGFGSITTMEYDLYSGALKQLGQPTSTGIPASGRPGCSNSLVLADITSVLKNLRVHHDLRLYASGDTGVAVFDIDPASGALRPFQAGLFAAGATGGRSVHYTGDTYVWAATAVGVVAFTQDFDGHLKYTNLLSTLAATSIALAGDRLYATRTDGMFDAWAVTYPLDLSQFPGRPVLTRLDGSPYGQPSASPAGITYRATRDGNGLLYATTTAGLRLWSVDSSGIPKEIDGSPFVLGLPGSTPGDPVFINQAGSSRMYLASVGSGSIVGAKIDSSGAPTPAAGSPWSYAPDLTNISCMIVAPGRSPNNPMLIASDAGNRRIGVFDVALDTGKPVPVAGSPFVMTETPSERASGIAVLGGP